MIALVAGSMFGIFIGFNPKNLSYATYLEQQQSLIKALNTLMPLMGMVTIVLTIISAFLQKENKTIFYTLLIAALCMIISGLVTKFGNQPINSMVMNWHSSSAPQNWMELRDKWWTLHLVRTFTAIAALFLIVFANFRKV